MNIFQYILNILKQYIYKKQILIVLWKMMTLIVSNLDNIHHHILKYLKFIANSLHNRGIETK